MEKRAYLITAVGAGGKTTYLRKRAQEYLSAGKRVALTTTTHIWPDPELDCFGRKEVSGKLCFPGEEVFSQICRTYDVVLVEGDGSHCMPAKIPGAHEPVVPENTDEIVVVMGKHAVGRRLDVVCQRFQSGRIPDGILRLGDNAAIVSPEVQSAGPVTVSPEVQLAGPVTVSPEVQSAGSVTACPEAQADSPVLVTEQLLRAVAEQFYLMPLKRRFPDAWLHYVLSEMPRCGKRIVGVLMASGFGRRYGGNKLLDLYRGKPLYRHTLDHAIRALGRENLVVVTQYGRIMQEAGELGIDAVMNMQAEEGIAASIRIGTKWATDAGADAVMFLAADMPYLPEKEIALYATQFLDSGKPYGCMEFGQGHSETNPGSFLLEQGAQKLLQLTGDRGAMRIMKQEPWNIYRYQIAPEWAEDIDTKTP